MTKEEELKSLLVAAQTVDLYPLNWLCKLRACRTSEWMSAPTAELALALAAVEFVGTYMWWLGQGRV